MIIDLEQREPVETVMISGTSAWPILRTHFYLQSVYKGTGINKSNPWGTVKNTLIGLLTLPFCRKKIIFSSTELDNRTLDSKRFNRYFYLLYQLWPKDQQLYLELPSSQTNLPKKSLNPKTVPATAIYSLAYLLSYFYRFESAKNVEVLEKIGAELGVTNLGLNRVPFHLAMVDVFSFLLKFWKPQIIVLSDYYSALNLALIQAAKRQGILVVEIQHGVINLQHPAYSVDRSKIDSSLMPDFLWTFDPKLSETLGERSFIPNERIVCLGHPYLTLVKQKTKVRNPKKDSTVRILVTLQSPVQAALIEFLKEAANLNPELHFTLLPRSLENAKLIPPLPTNQFTVLQSGDFYHLVTEHDLHLTVYSTCALEAPTLGIANILVDIDGWSKKVFGKQLSKENGSVYISDPKELKAAVSEALTISPELITAASQKWLATDFDKNARRFLEKSTTALR